MKKIGSVLILLVLVTVSVFASIGAERGDLEDSTGLFVMEVLFSNNESPYPVELWEDRDDELMSIFDIAREIQAIAKFKDRVFSKVEEDKCDVLFARLLQMEDIAERALVMEADQWKSGYVNELMKHIMGIRHGGISALIPGWVDPGNCNGDDSEKNSNLLIRTKDINIINPCDENGKRWTSQARLGEPKRDGVSIADYMQREGTDIQIIKNWWYEQLSGSWSFESNAMKFFYSNQRTVDPQSYYWQNGWESARLEYSTIWENAWFITDNWDRQQCYLSKGKTEEEYSKAFTIWHAYVQEVLSKTKFYHNNSENKELCVTRSNSANALKRNNITQFGKGYMIPSAAYDSCTLINVFGKGAAGRVIMELKVPHHRVFHLYPLLVPNGTADLEDIKILLKKVDFLKKYYDENGLLMIDKGNSLAVDKFVEEDIYYGYIQLKKDNDESVLKNVSRAYDYDTGFNMLEQQSKGLLKALPEQIAVEEIEDVLLNILDQGLEQDVEDNSTYFHETEVIIFSGPDLPFDYFYNTNDDLSGLEKRLDKGEQVCGYWPELKDLRQIGDLGGSTGALLYESWKTGKKYVLKRGGSEGHIREEALADNLYGVMGCGVPESRLYESDEGPVKVAVYLENAKSLYDAYYEGDEIEKKRLRDEISKGFVLDAFLGNFDVVGLDRDNILVGEDGKVYRVDNGGSLRYRAMGKLKNDNPDLSRKSWNASPIALWTLRDFKRNRNCAEIFKDLDIYEIAEQIKSSSFTASGVMEIKEGNIITTPSTFAHKSMLANNGELQEQVNKRHESFIKVADKALEMKAKGLLSEEAEVELRKWVEAQDWGPAFE